MCICNAQSRANALSIVSSHAAFLGNMLTLGLMSMQAGLDILEATYVALIWGYADIDDRNGADAALLLMEQGGYDPYPGVFRILRCCQTAVSWNSKQFHVQWRTGALQLLEFARAAA